MDALIILRRCMYRIHPQWWSKNYYSSQLPRNWLFPSKYGDFCMLWSIVIDCTFPVYFSWTRVLKLGKFQTGAFSSNTWNCPSSIFVTFRGQKMPPRSIWKKVSTLYISPEAKPKVFAKQKQLSEAKLSPKAIRRQSSAEANNHSSWLTGWR